MVAMTDLSVIGQHSAAVGSLDIVSGRAKYTVDLSFPDMLVGKLLYTDYPSACIVTINVEQARAIKGVAAVLTHADVPGENSYLLYEADQPLLAKDCVRFQGDALVAIAAEDEAAAQAALAAVEVVYRPLPGIFDPIAAMEPNAPQVWPGRSNVLDHIIIEHGDVEAGFAKADLILENTYTTQRVEQAFLEPEGAVARLELDGSVVVYASCQTPHRDRMQIARALGIPENRVRVIVPYVGGAFGGKDEAHVQIHAALLAYATGRPVRMVRTREESIRTHPKRHPMTIRYRSGITRDGLIVAIQVEAVADTGPYVNMGKKVLSVFATRVSGPYRVPSARIDAYVVHTNNPICGAMRGFGMPQAHLACERQMDELARAVGLDPLEIRLRNGLETGTQLPIGVNILEGSGMKKSLVEAARLAGWANRDQQPRAPGPNLRRGWGIACMLEGFGLGRNRPDNASVGLELLVDGSVILRTGAVDMGQGAHTVLAQLAAEALGVDLSAVNVVRPDTHLTNDAGASCASRVTFVSGNAVLRAAEPIRKALFMCASEQTGISEQLLTLRGGFLHADGERLSISVSELAAKARAHNLQLCTIGYYAMDYPKGTFSEKGYPHAPGFFTFGTQIARVLVDTETGDVIVEELVIVNDVGRVLNPDGALGQTEGGASMGYGYAVMEELTVDMGRTLTNSLGTYLIPTAKDVPTMKVRFLETPLPAGPYGARGMSEGSVIPTAPAILNAVTDAIGVPMNHLPVTPERVWAALEYRRRDQPRVEGTR